MSDKIQIKISDVVKHLREGVTRKVSSKHYKPDLGSIEEKYSLPPTQVDKLFKHPQLKNLRVRPKVEDMFELIDDTEEVDEVGNDVESANSVEEVSEEMGTAELTQNGDNTLEVFT